MQVQDLVTHLAQEQHAYRGDLSAPFRGFTLDTSSQPVAGRFYMVRDGSWPLTQYDPPMPTLKRAERLMLRAVKRGFTGVICSSDLEGCSALEGKNVFSSSDTFGLACDLAALVRRSLTRQRITAITGSAGKTSTKAMLLHSLNAASVGRANSTPGNRNLSPTVLRILSQSGGYQHTVLETSSAALQGFRTREFSISPDIGIVTSIGESHLEYMETVENVANVKSDIFQKPRADGAAVINLDTPHADLVVENAKKVGSRVITYGESPKATIRLMDWDSSAHAVTARWGEDKVVYTVGAGGKHAALNSLAVLGALRGHGIKRWRTAIKSLATFQALDGRGATTEADLPSGERFILIDESYNSNPVSIRTSLETLAARSVPEGGRRVAVLGDILELGDRTDQVHRELVEPVLQAGLDRVLLFGTHMRHLYEALQGRAGNVQYWEDLESLQADLPRLLSGGDTVLMKASRGTGLNDFVGKLAAARKD